MSTAPGSIIAIGYAKRILDKNSREYRRMQEYAERLGEYHVIVFTRRRDNLPVTLREGNLYVYGTNARTRLGMLYSAYRIGRKIIRDNVKPSWVVSSQDPFETSLVGRALARPPYVHHHVQIHGDVFNPHSYKESWLQRLRLMYGRYVVQRTAMVRVVSNRIKQSLVVIGVSPTVITVLPIQSDIQSFLQVGEQRVYDVAQPIRFLYVGRLASEKNLLLLIDAFADVAKKYPIATLALVGEGAEKSAIQTQIANHQLESQITLQGWTNDVGEVMSGADVFCLPSNHEGWAMVLVEAAAAGLAVVTTDVGCAGECVVDGESGKVVPVGDVFAFAQALEMYCAAPELVAQHGVHGAQLAAKHSLTAEVYLSRLVASYQIR